MSGERVACLCVCMHVYMRTCTKWPATAQAPFEILSWGGGFAGKDRGQHWGYLWGKGSAKEKRAWSPQTTGDLWTAEADARGGGPKLRAGMWQEVLRKGG